MVLVNACVIGSYWVKDKRRGTSNFFKYVLVPGFAAACTLSLWCQLSAMAKIVGFSFLTIGAIILGIKTKGFKEMPPEMDFSEVA